MNELIPSPETTAAIERSILDQGVRESVEASKAPATRRAYRTDWADFQRWCEERGEVSLPASAATIARYLVAQAKDHKASTVQRRITSINMAHRYAGVESQTRSALVAETMKGIKRQKAQAGEMVTQKEAAITELLRQMVAALPETPSGIHDRALLLLGFAGAFRRSELVALNVGDLRFSREGLVVTVRRSKTDQGGAGEQKGIPYGSNPDTCPVRAMLDWLEFAQIKDAPAAALFRPIDRHGNIKPKRLLSKGVALIVKEAAGRAGLDPTIFAGHSLRSGFATAAAMAGASERSIMNQTGHKSVTVARRYIRRGTLFQDNAATKVGL